MYDVLLIYLESDQDLGRQVRSGLESRSLSCLEPMAPLPGETYEHVLTRQVASVQWVVLVVSRDTLGSDWWEWLVGVAKGHGRSVAVVAGDALPAAALPPVLSRLQVVAASRTGGLAEEIAKALGRRPIARPPGVGAGDDGSWLQRHGTAVGGSSAGDGTISVGNYKLDQPTPRPPVPSPAPALSHAPAAADGPDFRVPPAPARPATQTERDAVFSQRMATDDVPTTVAAAPVTGQTARDAEYARRMAKEAVPITAGAAPSAASRDEVPTTMGARPVSGAEHRPADVLNDTLSTGTLLAMSAKRRAAARPSSVEGGRSQRSLETPDVGAAEPRRQLETSPTWFPPPPPGQPPAGRRVSMDEVSASQTVLRPSPTPRDGVTPSAGAPAAAGKGLSGFGTFLGVVLAALAVVGVIGGVFGGQDLFGKLLATLKLKLNAFTFFGLFGGDKKAAEPVADVVDCSVFAPPAAPPGETVMVQVFLHTAQQAERAQFMASVMDAKATLKGVQTLQTEIRRGARVTVALSAKGLEIDEPQQMIVWRGEPVFAQFLVTLPAGAGASTFHPVVRIAVDGGLVGRIAFAIRSDAQATMPRSVAAGEEARRYNHAFLSYASADRKEVLKRAQVLKAAGVSFFQDILSLDPGARWEKEIYKHIDRADLFLLFWSKSARDSEWVIREAEYALQRQGSGDVPDIVPVILEGPPVVRPPDSLAAIHFNDQINYLIALS